MRIGRHCIFIISSKNPWPEDSEDLIDRVPDEWLEEAPDGSIRVIRSRRDNLPEIHKVSLDGHLGQDGISVAIVIARQFHVLP